MRHEPIELAKRARKEPFRDCIYWEDEEFPTDNGPPVQGAWVCSYCGESSKDRRKVKHEDYCRFNRRGKR